MNIYLSEMQIIYILNALSFLLRCMTYHYQITDIKSEVKKFFNYDNYVDDYNNIMLLHRLISTMGNSQIYNLKNDIFFKGQKDFLCSKEKTFEILKDLSRYEIVETKEKIEIKNNKFSFKSKFKFFKKNIDKLQKVV